MSVVDVGDNGSIKETLSINEVDSLNRLLQEVNEFIVTWNDDDEVSIDQIVLNLSAKQENLGAITKYGDEDVKFEPGLRVEV
jgi:hypothetical protein